MRQNWFLTTIAYEKVAEEGRIVKVRENYLIDALSFTESEARIIEEMRPFISGEFVVAKATRARISEIFFNDDGAMWFKGKVNFLLFDEEKGVERKIPVTILAQANDLKEALHLIEQGMKGTMADYEIYSITTTDIEAVIKYEEEEKPEVD